MPRLSLVTKSDAIALVEMFIEHFKTRPYPEYSSNIYKQMSKATGNKWTPHCVYVNIKGNRRSIVSTACANKNIPFNDFPEEPHAPASNDSSQSDSDIDQSEDEPSDLSNFIIHITVDDWRLMRPSEVQHGNRRRFVLKKAVWTDVLSRAIYHQTRLRCAFVFRKHRIGSTPGSLYYLCIEGHCKSKRCRNPIFCYVENDPGDTAFNMTMRSRNIDPSNHDDVRRPLKGVLRQQVSQEVVLKGCHNWQQEKILKNTVFGQHIGSHIPRSGTFRQAKMEYQNKELNVKSSDGKDIIKAIEQLKVEKVGFIRDIKRDKFYVSFGTSTQFQTYQEYCRISKNRCTISVDGTGSIVQPLKRYDGSRSGHIFLYSIVINFGKKTISVFDLLTESQHTNAILAWLNEWQQLGASQPKFAVCDSSRALLNAMCRSFNQQTIKAYIETCFLMASNNGEHQYRSPVNTFIRLDVAHLMCMVSRWDCLKRIMFGKVRKFYLHCVALMCDCKSLEEFQEIFLMRCAIAMNQESDSTTLAVPDKPVEYCVKKLEKYVATGNIIFTENDLINFGENLQKDENTDEIPRYRSRIKPWIDNLKNISTNIQIQGTRINPYYCKDFGERLVSLSYEFPLWTAVTFPHIIDRGTSTFSEGHFKDLKHVVLRNYSGPLRIDKFLRLEYVDNAASATLVSSKMRQFNEEECSYLSPQMKKPRITQIDAISSETLEYMNLDSIRSEGNWMTDNGSNVVLRSQNLNSIPCSTSKKMDRNNDRENVKNSKFPNTNIRGKENEGYYFKPHPEIFHQNDKVTSNLYNKQLSVLKNGSLLPRCSVMINGRKRSVINTCGWDSIVQILHSRAMNDKQYFESLRTSHNETLKFVSNFTEKGVSAAIYKNRIKVCELLSNMTEIPNEENRLAPYVIDMWNSVADIWIKCFESESSAFNEFNCPNCGLKKQPLSTLWVNHKVISEKGFNFLQQASHIYHDLQSVKCITQDCTKMCSVKTRCAAAQIFIELNITVDLSKEGFPCKLSDFPDKIDIDGQKYRLAGVVAYITSNFMAYCRRDNCKWVLCNDQYSKPYSSSPSTSITPHGVIYTKIFPDDCHQNYKLDKRNEDSTLSDSDLMSTNHIFQETANLPNIIKNDVLLASTPEAQKSVFKNPFIDSDIMSQDNWRNRGIVDSIYEDWMTDDDDDDDDDGSRCNA